MEQMLADLVTFSHLRDGKVMMINERNRDIILGRQEVVWRILNHLHMSEADLFALYNATSTGVK